MPILAPRRCFQFRLSTWFVLVGILAWAMVIRSATPPAPIHFGHKDVLLIPFKPTFSEKGEFPLMYPTLALAAFAGWKVAWAIGRRVQAKRAEPHE